jgi:outer membrane protein assembly factor BamB
LSWGALGALCFLAAVAPAADWPQWRGPGRDGQVPGFSAPETWPKQLQRQWKVNVGQGHASPVVSGDRVFLFSRMKDDEVVRALALADGKEIWRESYAAEFQPSPYALGHGKGPKATPVVAGDKLYTLGIDSILTCWDAASGKRLWQKEHARRFKKISPLYYGMAASPLVHGELLLAFVGRHGEGALRALDRKTGEARWEWGGDGPGYASALVAEIGGTPQVITQSQSACVGISAADGSLLWTLPLKTEYDQNIVTPVVAGGLVIFAGLDHPTAAYRLKAGDGKWTPEKAWENEAVTMYMSSPVVAGDRLVGLSNKKKGQFFSLNLADGKTLWTSDGRMGENAALLAAGDTVLALTTNSELLVFPASAGKFEPLARYKVADKPTWAHPAVVGRQVLIKDADSVALWSW